MFAMKAGRGHKAWYVGKTKKSFYSECMGSHQQDHYQEVFARGIKGTPVMFFIAPNNAKKVVPRKVLGQIERFLIQAALLKNPDLRNNHHAAQPEWSIKGVIRGSAGKPTSEASKFATMMGVVK
ncbi:MAG: hypothetical protein IPF59_08085 [Ignavibacteria bacterium]|nr:hypothetical protein [Ignavibacteria bacterium]